MKIAIMQPYFFPYIGYFQLINVADIFVFYDDVNYIKGGFINRNYIYAQGKKERINLPILKASSFKNINEIERNLSPVLQQKIFKQLHQNYQKAPFYKNTIHIIEKIFDYQSKNISEFLINSTIVICDYIGIETEFIVSSLKYTNSFLEKESRIIDICNLEKCNLYINSIGGQDLYSKEYFKEKNINLKFLNTQEIKYKQFKHEFVSNLSIIDVLMFNSKSDIIQMLDKYKLV